MEKSRKQYTGEEKVATLRRHLLEQEPVSKRCDELGLQPTVFYRWQNEFFENGAAAFQAKAWLKPAPITRPSRNASRIWRRRSARTKSWRS